MRNIAVIGAGRWGQNLVRNFYELGVLRSVCDCDESALNWCRLRYPGIEVEQDADKIIKDPSIKGVVIATPDEYHYTHAKAALENRKDVFVEKPMALSVRDAEEMVEIASKNKCILMVGHLMQYHPAFRKLKQIVFSRDFGAIRKLYAVRGDIFDNQSQTSALWSFAPHDLSMILSIIKSEIENIKVQEICHIFESKRESIVTKILFSNGLTAELKTGWSFPHKEQIIIIVGEKLTAVFDDLMPWEKKLITYVSNPAWIIERPENLSPYKKKLIFIEPEEPLKKECLHFLHCIQMKSLPVTDGEDSLKVIEILTRIQNALSQSFKEDRCLT